MMSTVCHDNGCVILNASSRLKSLLHGLFTGVCGILSKFTFCSIAHADPAQLRARAQPNAVGHAEPALVLGLGAAR
jgi:hypothetical protein